VSSSFDDVDVDRLRRRRTVKWSLYPDDVLAAWVAEMDFDVAPVVREAIEAAVDRDDFGYLVADLTPLTTACTSFLERRFGWAVAPPRIFPIADVLTGIRASLEILVPEGPIVVPTPAYPPFFEIVELAQREPVAAPLLHAGQRYELDLTRIEDSLRRGAAAVLLCNPHNPTGRAFEPDELRALSEIVDRYGARVVADEVHAPLVFSGSVHVPYATIDDASSDHTVTITSASKAFNLAGLKCAQLIASSKSDARRWRQLRVFEVPGPTPIGVAASIAAYTSGDPWLDALVEHLRDRRDQLAALIDEFVPAVRWRCPDATFLAWLDCSALGLDDPAAHFLHHGRVAVSDGPPFGPDNEQFVRLNFATSSALLRAIAERMSDAIRRPGARQ
jgi:cysteine-S-conjugate beta-lyase